MSARQYKHSPVATPFKQMHVSYILSRLMGACRSIRNNPKYEYARQQPLLYIDLYAGPGMSPPPDEGYGSPLIFRHLAQDKFPDLPWEAHFFENDLDTYEQLAHRLRNTEYIVHYTDNRNVIDILPTWPDWARHGIVYADPSNADVKEVTSLLLPIARSYRKVDILINIAAASWKRRIAQVGYQHMTDLLEMIPKKHRLIRSPYGPQQWTMFLLTNYVDFKPDERKRWYDISSEAGQAILERVTYTGGELNDRLQPPLF